MRTIHTTLLRATLGLCSAFASSRAELPTRTSPLSRSLLPIAASPSIISTFDRYLSFREGWALQANIDWRQMTSEQRDALVIRLESIREEAQESVARLEALRLFLAAKNLPKRGVDLRAQVAAGAYFGAGVDAGFGVDFNGLSWAPYAVCTIFTCDGGAVAYAGLGFGKSEVEKPYQANWVHSASGTTWGGAILFGKSVRTSNQPAISETVETIGMGMGGWRFSDNAIVTQTSYRGVGARIPLLLPIRIPTLGSWHWYRALGASHRLVRALRQIQPETADRELRSLRRHLAALESSLGDTLRDFNVSQEPMDLGSHPLASAENLFRPQTLIDAENSLSKRLLQACGRYLGWYGSKSIGYEPEH